MMKNWPLFIVLSCDVSDDLRNRRHIHISCVLVIFLLCIFMCALLSCCFCFQCSLKDLGQRLHVHVLIVVCSWDLPLSWDSNLEGFWKPAPHLEQLYCVCFVCIFWIWYWRLGFWGNDLLHMEHLCGLSPVCALRMWLLRLCNCENYLSHELQECGLSLLCTSWWAFNEYLSVNLFSQWTHWKGCSPVWILLCRNKVPVWENLLSQKGQLCNFSPVWVSWCCSSFLRELHLILQKAQILTIISFFIWCTGEDFMCFSKSTLAEKQSLHSSHRWGRVLLYEQHVCFMRAVTSWFFKWLLNLWSLPNVMLQLSHFLSRSLSTASRW